VRPLFGATNAGTLLKYSTLALIAVALMLSACFDKSPVVTDNSSGGVPLSNSAPTISGSPPTSIRVGESYAFTPTANDPDGDMVTFSISNKPSWASFDKASGRLSGQPQDVNAGIAANISIMVSDGKSSAALARFSISVNQISMGSATLSWMPPTQNADGTALTDLRGYKIYYGKSAASQNQAIRLTNPGLTLYVIDNLSPATWYFSMSSFNSKGVDSVRSATASKSIT
jgi:hypothetical protein